MRKKLLGNDVAPACQYCVYGEPCAVDGEILCPKRGVMRAESSCRKFSYDPLKRRPDRPQIAQPEAFSQDDFKL